MVNWKRDSVVCVLLLCFYAAMYAESIELKAVARTYPQCLMLLCAIFTAVLLVKSISARHTEAADGDTQQKKTALAVIRDIAVICAALVTYALAIKILGYITSSVAFIAGTLLYLGIRKWYVVAGVSLGTTLFLYYMFNHLLGILLPSGFLI